MSAIFGISGSYSEKEIQLMQTMLSIRSSANPIIFRFDGGFIGCLPGAANPSSQTLQNSSGGVVIDGYLDRSHSANHFLDASTSDLNRVAGLYASAALSSVTGFLTLYRDPSGARPLYYHRASDRFIFASSPRAIVHLPGISRRLNPEAVSLYLTMICPPDPVTIYQSVETLRPGFQLQYVDKNVKITRFASSPATMPAGQTPADTAQNLRSALELAIIDAIPQDHQNTAFFLSGGTDTGAVVGLAAKAGISPINTYTIGYEGSGTGYDAYNEFYYAKLIADRYHTIHHEFTISPDTVKKALPGIVFGLDQPSGDAINTYLVAGTLPATTHTVLTGTGGDEIFIGSHWFKQQARLREIYARWQKIPEFLRKTLTNLAAIPGGSIAGRIHRLNALKGGPPAQYKHFKFLFSDRDKRDLLQPDYRSGSDTAMTPEQIVDIYDELHKDSDPINRIESLLFQHEVSNLQLRDVDSMSHAHGFEARSPLVDKRVLDVLNPVPGLLKAPDGHLRHLMFQALDDCLLMETRTRKKMSFIVPMDLWARRELRPAIEHLLSRDVVMKRGILQPEAVQKEMDAFFVSGKERHPFKVWNLALLELWCRVHIDAPAGSQPPSSLDDLL